MTMLLLPQLLRVCCIMWWSSQAFGFPAARDQTRPRSNNRNENENINHSASSCQQPAYPMHSSFALAPNMHSTFTPSSQSLPFAAHPLSSAYHNSMQPQHAFTPHQNIIQPSAQYSTPLTAPGTYMNNWQASTLHDPHTTPFQSIVSVAQGYQYPRPQVPSCPATQAITPLQHSLPAPQTDFTSLDTESTQN